MWEKVVLISALVAMVLGQRVEPGAPGGPSGSGGPSGEVPMNYTFDETYVVIVSKVMSPGDDYDVIFTYLDTAQYRTVNVQVEIRTDDTDSIVVATKRDTLPEAKCDGAGVCEPVTKVVAIPVPLDLVSSSYNITVSGDAAGQMFSNSTTVKLKRKTTSVFIQTDKALYKPSQKVQFRVVTIDKNMQYVKAKYNVSIHDVQDNRIKQYINVEPADNAVFSGFLELSDQPVLGNWQIKVDGGSFGASKMFEVAEYVLPKYEIILDIPNFMLVTDRKIMTSVSAKYTYGQAVKGKCLMNASMDVYSYERTEAKSINITKELKDGKVDFEFSIEQLETLVPPPSYRYDTRTVQQRMSYRSFMFSTCCTEELTGKVLCDDGKLRVESQKFRISFMENTPQNFRPNMMYNAYVQVTLIDGSPIPEKDFKHPNGSQIPMRLYDSSTYYRYNRDADQSPQAMAEIYPTSQGIGIFKILVPEAMTSLSMLIEFAGQTTSKYVQPFKTRDGGALQISTVDSDGAVKAGEMLKFNITTRTTSSNVYVQLIAKNEVVKTEIMMDSKILHEYAVLMTDELTQKLAPSGRILVWYITETGEIISDSHDFSVDGLFTNKVSLKFNVNETKPAKDVMLTVVAEPSSFVAVLALDQSMLLLGTGNDLTEDEVAQEMKTYDSTNQDFYRGPYFGRGERGKRSSMWYPYSMGGKDSSEIIKNAGCVIMTDSYIYVEPPPRYYYPSFRGERGERGQIPEGAMAGPGGPPMAGARGPAPAPAPPARAPGSAKSADSASSTQSNLKQVTRVRTNFPETWLWQESVIGDNGEVNIKTTVPDTITSWVASAFAMHPVKGLGLSKEAAKITVFKPFFISLDLPYSVIRGEEVELKMIVFNYLSVDLYVQIDLDKSLEFGVKGANDIDYSFSKVVMKNVKVEAYGGRTVSVWIKPAALGNIALQASARSTVAADAVRRMLLVELEGVEKEYAISVMLDASDNGEMTKALNFSVPTEDLVRDSVKISTSLIGDIMGPAISNLGNLVRMPYGCGEQNMLNFAPNIFVMKYLTASSKGDQELKDKIILFTEKGYQRELTYRHYDGSFSAFGNSDPSGSTWLTAFVAKSFYQARTFIDIDMDKLAVSVNWMMEQQIESGRFLEPGRVIHTDMQGGSASGLSMNAYVIMALIDMRGMEQLEDSRVDRAIKKGLVYLWGELDNKPGIIQDPYVMAVLAYTMALADNEKKDEIFDKMNDLAITEDGLMYWGKKKRSTYESKKQGGPIIWIPPVVMSKTSEIESTAYALLSYVAMGKLTEAVPVMKWLVSKRNSLGGYGSTQDTVMALMALSVYAAELSQDGGVDMAVSVRTGAGKVDFNRVTVNNMLVLQIQELGMSGAEDTAIVEAEGTGMALLQLSVQYNIIQTHESEEIQLDIHSTLLDDGTVSIEICALYHPEDDSGMGVFEAKMLSGFEATNIEELKSEVKGLRRVDQSGQTYYFYMDQFISGQMTCITVESAQTNKVNKLQKGKVVAYPYYKTENIKTGFYMPSALVDLDLCEACPTCCDNDGGVEMEFIDKQTSKHENEVIHRGHTTRSPYVAASSTVPMATALLPVLIIGLFMRKLF